MKTLNFANLWIGSRFKLKDSKVTLVKMGNSHAREEQTGNDVIPALSDKCIPMGKSTKFIQYRDEEVLIRAGKAHARY